MSVTQPTKGSTRLVFPVGAVIALAIMGDSLMYSLLPLQAETLGFSLAGAGLLLSANRIVRLLSNTWAGLAFERWGSRWPFLFAAILSVLTTALYGAGLGFFVFLLARIGWGVAWSIFRQGGYVAVWAGTQSNRGKLMGTLWGVVRVGSAVSVLLGGYLYDRFNFATAAGVIALLTFLAIPASLLIRWSPKQEEEQPRSRSPLAGWREGLDASDRRWILAVGFMYTMFESVVAVTLSKFIALHLSDVVTASVIGIGTIAGLMLAFRFVADLIFAPLLGSLSDRFGQSSTIAFLTIFILVCLIGVVNLAGIWSLFFLALVFFAGSGIFAAANAAGSSLAMHTTRPHLFVGLFTTTIDAGAAIGPLLAFPAVALVGFGGVYMITASLLSLTALRFWYVFRSNRG